MTKKPTEIRFIATYDDAKESTFLISRFDLRTGDHVARIIAGERQRAGELPEGKIVSVRRAPFNIQP